MSGHVGDLLALAAAGPVEFLTGDVVGNALVVSGDFEFDNLTVGGNADMTVGSLTGSDTLEIGGDFEARYFDIKKGYHGLSHHGQVKENIDALLVLEDYQMKHFSRFLTKLKSIPDGDGTLLDHTMVLFGSGMANANAHTNKNLPIILAGGGFEHGGYRSLPQGALGRTPLCNLYVSMLQRFGVGIEAFGTSTGTLL